MGGVMAQEIIKVTIKFIILRYNHYFYDLIIKKAISKKNEPVNNFFVFDGNLMSGEVMTIS